MQNQRIIEQLGYSPNEAKVYLAILALGEAHITDVAEKVKMPHSTVQVIVERLHENGLVRFYVMSRYKYWIAEDPVQLLLRLKHQEELIEGAIPSLVALKQKARKRLHDLHSANNIGPLQQLADTMHHPCLITTNEAEIRYVNDSWVQQFGYKSKDVIGKNTSVLKSGKTSQKEYERLWQSITAGKFFESDSIVDMKKNGTYFSLFTLIFPTTYGNRTFYIQILEDRSLKSDYHKNRQEFQQVVEY